MTWCEIRSLIKTDSLDPKASNLTCKAIVKKFLPERYPCKYLTFDILCASSLVLLVCGSFRLIFASKYSCDQCTSLLGTVETVAKEAPLASAIVTGGLAIVGVVFTIIYQTSVLSFVKCRIKAFQFDTRITGCELPANFCLQSVSL